MTDFQIHGAERRQLLAKIGISSPSGGGKTYSGLLLARGLVGDDGVIVVLDSEQRSSEMYSDLTKFQVVPLEQPYSPARYMAALDFIEGWFETQGVPLSKRVLLMDQISNAWAGAGGLLEFVDRQKTSSGASKGFSAWKDATPIQQAFVERMLRFKGHLIVTMRSKVEWVIEKNERGQNTPKKVGLSPVQREGIEYEFQAMLDLSNESNLASVSKDRTRVFTKLQAEEGPFKITTEVGAAYRRFLDSGVTLEANPPLSAPRPAQAPPQETVEETSASPAEETSDTPFVSPAEVKLIMAAARKRGMPLAEVKQVVKEIAGVEQSAQIPKGKFAEILKAVSPQEAA